ncbi:MAG TPA: peptidylprolyl isomerase [Candidatus Dormibacteraeota bacterium]|nr:peptidylprolyl isomerase [Candidatus Dormibacteraeota bacterium]
MKYQRKHATMTGTALLVLTLTCGAQVVASHAPTLGNAPAAAAAVPQTPTIAPGNPIVRVNGAVLTDRDLAREIQTIFPYVQTHNGVPKSMEPEMRQGALDMIIFEELVYQEALRRKMTVSPERMKAAEIRFRKQFTSSDEFNRVMQVETQGSRQLMREKIRRSLLIEDLLKSDVADKAKVSLAEARAYYDRNPKKFAHPEMFSIQTISFIPPGDANPDALKEAAKHADDALKAAKATKSYQEFGLLAEKVSEDDWHVNMGDRKAVEREKLPPPVVTAALAMKPGQVSDLIQLGTAYTLFRLNAHVPAGTTPFDEVKTKLATDLQKEKNEHLRSALNKRLRKAAKIEVL